MSFLVFQELCGTIHFLRLKMTLKVKSGIGRCSTLADRQRLEVTSDVDHCIIRCLTHIECMNLIPKCEFKNRLYFQGYTNILSFLLDRIQVLVPETKLVHESVL